MECSSQKTASFIFSLILFLFQTQPLIAQEMSASSKNKQPQFSSVEERRIYTKMQKEQKGVNEGQKDLTIRKKELKTLNEAVDKKLEELNRKLQELQTMESSLKVLLAQKNAEEVKKIKALSLIYEKMTPDKAALAISKMDDKLATKLLANMRVKSAAKILDALDRKKATELSKTFSTVK